MNAKLAHCKKILILCLLPLLTCSCVSVHKLGNNKVEGFTNKKIEFVDYSSKGEPYSLLKGIFLKVDSLSYIGTVTSELGDKRITWNEYLASVGLKLGLWEGVKKDHLKLLKKEQVKFRFLVTIDDDGTIQQQLLSQALAYANSLKNDNCPSFPEVGVLKKEEVLSVYKLSQFRNTNQLTISFLNKILKIQTLSKDDEQWQWGVHYVLYDLLGGVAFKVNDSAIFQPSFDEILSCEDVVKLNE